MDKNKMTNIASNTINVMATVSSVAAMFNPTFIATSAVSSVLQEVCGFFDNKSIEKRLKKLETAVQEQNITFEEFRERVDSLDEHDQYALRNNVKHLCVNALPEVTDSLIDAMIAFLIENDHHEMNEELCEILRECNSEDINLLRHIKEYLKAPCHDDFNEHLKEKTTPTVKEHENDTLGLYPKQVWKDRNRIYEENTIFWTDFLKTIGLEEKVSASTIMNTPGVLEDGTETLEWTYLIRSLFKMQHLGVIEIEFSSTLGTITEYNIDRFHITLYGRNLIKHIK